jgi:hypothetical protein
MDYSGQKFELSDLVGDVGDLLGLTEVTDDDGGSCGERAGALSVSGVEYDVMAAGGEFERRGETETGRRPGDQDSARIHLLTVRL